VSTQTDVNAVTASATGNLGIGNQSTSPALVNKKGVRIKGVYYSCTTGGTVTLSDVINTTEVYLTIVVPVGSNSILIPGEGIRADNDIKLTLTTTVGSITIFYG
jgi:hypothetical protein